VVRHGRVPWVAVVLVTAFAAVSFAPGVGEALQYDRGRVAAGGFWRLLTSQAVHWTPRMTLVDLAALLGLGAWLEWRGARRVLLTTLVLAAGLTALAVHVLSQGLDLYRGSSGLSSGLFVLTALCVAGGSSGTARIVAGAALVTFAGKAGWEVWSGRALFAGALPPGVRVVPLVHLLGGLGGFVAWAIHRRAGRGAT